MAQDGQLLVDAIAALWETDVPLLSIMHSEVQHVDACLDMIGVHRGWILGVYAQSGAFKDGSSVFEGTISPMG